MFRQLALRTPALTPRTLTLVCQMSQAAAEKKPTVLQPEWFVQPRKDGPVLKVYNSLTRSKTEFIPINPNHIVWYSCGPTVYTHSHMGHARNYVTTDINRRLLLDYFGYNIRFIQNVTDIDDKIIIAARHQYLFEQYVLEKYTSSSPEVIDLGFQALIQYVEKNLPASVVNGASSTKVEAFCQNLMAWIKTVDPQKEAAAVPKFPMYVKAAGDAANALLEASSLPFDVFAAKIQDVTMPYLDKLYGNSVSDPSIFKKLPSYWEGKFNEDMARLNVLPPSITTRVLEYIPEIITYVEKIIKNGYAYATTDGSVYFDTAKFENSPNHVYAKLQPWNKGDMTLIEDGEGSLASVSAQKKSAVDFALWKGSKPGEPAWDSPWGAGRPGWHIECSVMALDVAGEQMDIHTGGVDLCFPHHDNELAQSEAYFNNRQWVNYFLHNGHLHIQGQKMSKSLKNFITIQEALDEFSTRQLRLVFAMSPWEKTIDFKDTFIKEVKAWELTLLKFFTTVRALNNDDKHALSEGKTVSKKLGPQEKQLYKDLESTQSAVHEAFCDNLSTPQALKSILELVGKANGYIQSTSQQGETRLEPLIAVVSWATKILSILGFETRLDGLGWAETEAGEAGVSAEDVALPYVKLLSQFRDSVRNSAIDKEEYGRILAACDAIRNDLIKVGVLLDDRPNKQPALVKFLNAQEQKELVEQQAAKEQLLAEKQRKKEQAALVAAQKEQERLEKLKVDPKQMFKDTTLYSEWDEEGLPTKDAKGEEVTKSMRKKLSKQQQQQEKLHKEYLSRK